MEDRKIDKHESYGMIGISNVRSNIPMALFGSSIKHSEVIRLRIKHAEVDRHLHREWYYARRNIVEIELSASQFAQFITNPNIGDGIPCTIKCIEGKTIEDPPYRGQNEIFNEELKADFYKAMEDADDLIEEAKETLTSKGNIKVKDKKKLLDKLEMLVQHIRENMPFLHKQFTRSMDKTVTEAKAEIEQIYTSMIMKMGKKALEENSFEKPLIEQNNNRFKRK